MSCNEDHTAAVGADGTLYTWGTGEDGKLGHGDTQRQLLPMVVEALADVADLCYRGVLPLRAMAYSSLFLIPSKGQYDQDTLEIIRTPDNLRPLSGRNADSKTIARGVALMMNPFLSDLAPLSSEDL